MLEIIVDSHIRIPGLSQEWKEGLAKLCSVPNEDKDVALREKIRGAAIMDDLLTLADIQGDDLVLPRGFYTELTDILASSDIPFRVKWNTALQNDNTSLIKIGAPKHPVASTEQLLALNALHGHLQGRVIMPPGKGKTVVGLWNIFSREGKSIILVDKKHIAQQWVDRAKEHFDVNIGFIGDNRWEEKDTTVALIQTLRSRKDQLDGWWHKWSMLILDEQHHIPAETYTEIIQKFPAHFRFGLSATVGKSESKKKISELVFGPIIYESKQTQVNPTVQRVFTDFDFNYHPTRKRGNKIVRNNYQKMVTALIQDVSRNQLIAQQVCKEPQAAHLIVSQRLKHLEALANICANNGMDVNRCWFLTGQESLEERMEVYEWADAGSCAVFSTLGVAGEALDIPRLDRLHITTPIKNEETLWQVIGRIARTHDNKSSAIVFDYVDREVEVLYNQYKHRLRACYQPKKLNVGG